MAPFEKEGKALQTTITSTELPDKYSHCRVFSEDTLSAADTQNSEGTAGPERTRTTQLVATISHARIFNEMPLMCSN